METSQSKIIGQALGPMGVFSVLSVEDRVCEKHGEYKAMQYKHGWVGCAGCLKEKIEAEERERQESAESERRKRQAERILARACIPMRFSDRRLDTFVDSEPGQKKALAIARAYVDGFDKQSGQSLIFCGGVGSGKTHLSVGIAHCLMGKQYMCIFTSVIGAIRSVKETYSRNSEITERQALDNLIEPDLLILDEVGVQFGSEAEKMILFEIINGRYENMKSTIVISNLAKDPLTEYLGERVVDRLREGGGKMVVFDWPSYRRTAA
jgi:DNA replication protein DnaC